MSGLTTDLGKLLADFDSLGDKVDRQAKEIEALKAKLKTSREWNGRLNEKITALEKGSSFGPDGWDEKFLFDLQATIKFRKRSRGDADSCYKLVISPRAGRKTIVFGGLNSPLLQEAIEKMNGRKRAGSQQQKAKEVNSEEAQR